jgi:hypothetical protein
MLVLPLVLYPFSSEHDPSRSSSRAVGGHAGAVGIAAPDAVPFRRAREVWRSPGPAADPAGRRRRPRDPTGHQSALPAGRRSTEGARPDRGMQRGAVRRRRGPVRTPSSTSRTARRNPRRRQIHDSTDLRRSRRARQPPHPGLRDRPARARGRCGHTGGASLEPPCAAPHQRRRGARDRRLLSSVLPILFVLMTVMGPYSRRATRRGGGAQATGATLLLPSALGGASGRSPRSAAALIAGIEPKRACARPAPPPRAPAARRSWSSPCAIQVRRSPRLFASSSARC